MEYIEKLKDSLARYEKDLNDIKKAKNFDEIAALEREAWNAGVDTVMMANNIRRDLAVIADARRRELSNPTMDKATVKVEEKPAKKTTKRAKKA